MVVVVVSGTGEIAGHGWEARTCRPAESRVGKGEVLWARVDLTEASIAEPPPLSACRGALAPRRLSGPSRAASQSWCAVGRRA